MERATRRGFLRTAFLGALALGPLAAVGRHLSGETKGNVKSGSATIRIKPENPALCSPSFVRYCERARFATATEAAQVARRTSHPFLLYVA